MTTDTLIPLINIPSPPMLTFAFGYNGQQRFVGFWWSKNDDSPCCYDGIDYHYDCGKDAWETYVKHEDVWPHLESLHLGTPNQPASHILVIDTHTNTVYAALIEPALLFLRRNNYIRTPEMPYENDDPDEALSHYLSGSIDSLFSLCVWLDNKKDKLRRYH